MAMLNNQRVYIYIYVIYNIHGGRERESGYIYILEYHVNITTIIIYGYMWFMVIHPRMDFLTMARFDKGLMTILRYGRKIPTFWRWYIWWNTRWWHIMSILCLVYCPIVRIWSLYSNSAWVGGDPYFPVYIIYTI